MIKIKNNWERDISYYHGWYFKNGYLKTFPVGYHDYTPVEWVESLQDVNEIKLSYAYYAESFYSLMFIRHTYSKRKKCYIKREIRIHRKLICLYIAENPEIKIYKGKQLEEYKKDLEEKVYSTFSYQTRSTSFNNLKVSGRCLNCSLLLSETKRNSWRYCSLECKERFYLSYRFDFSRDWVWQRDRGICQICKRSTRFIEEEIHKLWYINNETKEVEYDIVHISLFEDDRIIKFKRTKGRNDKIYYLPYYIRIRTYDIYEIDHIIEVASVDDPKEQVKLFVDYNNLQTVCKPCHKKKTGDFLRKKFTKKKKSKSKTVDEFL